MTLLDELFVLDNFSSLFALLAGCDTSKTVLLVAVVEASLAKVVTVLVDWFIVLMNSLFRVGSLQIMMINLFSVNQLYLMIKEHRMRQFKANFSD